MKKQINMTLPLASLGFSVLVSMADDDPSEEEAVVLRKYFRIETAEALQKLMTNEDLEYPTQIAELKSSILETLKKAEKAYRLWALAVAFELAHADGVYDRSEIMAISEAAEALECPMYEVRIFAEKYLQEISSEEDYAKIHDISFKTQALDLTEEEAGLALSVLVAFADDNPSDKEVGVVREYYSSAAAEELTRKMKVAGLRYPQDLGELKPAILKGLSCYDRDLQVKHLAIAYKTAGADGQIDSEETAILKEFCAELYIGIGELPDYFKAEAAV